MSRGRFRIWAVLVVLLAACGQGGRRTSSDPKMALIDTVDRALRSGDGNALLALLLAPERIDALCPDLPAEARGRLRETAERRRAEARDGIRECLDLADWSGARPVMLNYGARSEPAESGCRRSFLSFEKSELYYVLDDTVLKVTLWHPYAVDGAAGLTKAPDCSVKPLGTEDLEESARRLGLRCRIGQWPMVTQTRGAVPCE